MKKPNNKILLYLGILSLFIIIAIVTAGTLQGQYNFFLKRGTGSIVLGISADNIENTLEGIVSQARGEISKKAIEAEGKIKTSIEKEVSDFTSSQIKSIQLKIC